MPGQVGVLDRFLFLVLFRLLTQRRFSMKLVKFASMMVLGAFASAAWADNMPVADTKILTEVVAQAAPAKNPQSIIDKMNTLLPEVKKGSFPEDKSSKNLSGTAPDAMKDANFKRA